MDINAITLTGRLTQDPKIFYSQSGTGIANISIANNYSVKRGEEWQQETSFFKVVVFGKQAENIEKYLVKGQEVAINGEIRQTKWEDKDGNKRTSYEIIAKTVKFGSKPKSKGSYQEEQAVTDETVSEDIPNNEQNDVPLDTDDIPF